MIPNYKKEVDLNIDTVYWNGDKTDLAFFQSIVDAHNMGKSILIVTKNIGKQPTVIPFYENEKLVSNKYILTSVVDNTRVMSLNNVGYNQLQLVHSRLDITLENNTVSKVDYNVTTQKSFDYLDATSPNKNNIYIPVLDNHPATKKYVDDKTAYKNYSTGETLTGDIWIDGNPVYRKVIQINRDIKNLNTFAHNISNYIDIIDVKGYAKVASNAFVPINSCLTNGDKQYNSCVCIEGSNVIFYLSNDREKFISANVIIEYTKAL